MKTEESEEIEFVHRNFEEESNEILAKIQELKRLVNKYKMQHLEDLNYKERYNDFINSENFQRSND